MFLSEQDQEKHSDDDETPYEMDKDTQKNTQVINLYNITIKYYYKTAKIEIVSLINILIFKFENKNKGVEKILNHCTGWVIVQNEILRQLITRIESYCIFVEWIY